MDSCISSLRMNFRACCLFSLFLLLITGSARATAPAAPTNLSMPKYTYYNSATQVWRVQWTDNSTDEDGFQIHCRYGGTGPDILYQTVPTSLSLTSVTTTSGSTTVTCADTTSLAAGWTVTGTNIPTGTTVASVTNSTTFVLSAAATGTASGQTLSAVSIYKAGSGYTYAMNIGVGSNSFPGYHMDWWVVAYKGIPASEVSGSTNTVTFGAWPGSATPSLTAPSGLTVTASGDGQFHIAYNDNSNCEQYFELDYKLHTATTWTGVGLDFGGSPTGAGATDVGGYQSSKSVDGSATVYLPNFQPGTAYDFQLRAVDYSYNASAFTSAVTATTQAFKGPTNLVATLKAENTFDLSFSNNSTAASGYHFQYQVQGSSTWQELGTVDNPYFNTINTGPLDPKTTYLFQVQAYIRGSNDTSVAAILSSAYSNAATGTTTFNVPSGLTATSVSESQVNLTWVDNSLIEGGYMVYYRVSGSGSFNALLSTFLPANTTTYSVTGLTAGTAYDFQVTAGYQGASAVIESSPSNTASMTTKDGFTSLTYAPITYNQPFSYQAVVSTVSARNSWSITNLPAGLTFNSSTGIISGTPTVTGVVSCPMTATFASGWTTNNTLTLRIILPAAAPVAATAISGQTLARGGNTAIPLTDKFADPDSESAVRVITNKGTMDFILYNTATPLTVANFLSYVNNPNDSGNYNGAVFHRSVPGFVVQGGGFKVQSAPNNFTSITTTASPTNEPGISNLRGTVAMAKVGSNPNSATDQFFVSLADNSSNLDNQNGGFTVFARVAGNGMSDVVDKIAALPTVNTTVNIDGTANTSLTGWPVLSGSTMDTSQVVSITSAAPVAVLSYSVTGNTNPTAVNASISGTSLQITGAAGGQSNVTVTATDLDGNTVSQTFTVTVNQAAAFTGGAPSANGTVGSTYSFSYAASGFPAPTFSLTSGALPTGLSLSTAGVLSGTCTVAGTFTGVVTATNSNGSDTQGFSIVVDKGTASIALSGLTQTYDGSPKGVTATPTPSGLSVSITYNASSSAPSDFGSYAVVATVNDANYTGTQSGTLVIQGQSSSGWKSQHFTAGQVSSGAAADTADPDGDGLKNLAEYALGTDPLSRNAAPQPTHDANGLTLLFTRPKGLPDVTYSAESTDTLGSWSPVTLEVITDGPVQTVRARDPLTSGNPTRRFMHLIFGTP